jgi:hypothetical protein
MVFAYLGVSYDRINKPEEADKIYSFLKTQLPDQAQQMIDQARKQNQPAPVTTETTPAKN